MSLSEQLASVIAVLNVYGKLSKLFAFPTHATQVTVFTTLKVRTIRNNLITRMLRVCFSWVCPPDASLGSEELERSIIGVMSE